MALDLLPLRHLSFTKDGKRKFSFGDTLVHSVLAPCPFAADGNPTSPLISCCSFHARLLVEGLETLGETAVVRLMHGDMTAEQALAFAEILDEVANRWDKVSAEDWGCLFGQSPEEGEETDRQWIYLTGTGETAEDVLCVIWQAATWYKKIGDLGCFVFASH